MALKIISGIARGIVLTTPDDRAMRPTAGKAREALFSSLGDLRGVFFADLFAGSGAMALEAASRGASAIVCVEKNSRHVGMIEQNIQKVRKAGAEFSDRVLSSSVRMDTLPLPEKPEAFSRCIFFLDPPYRDTANFFAEFCHHGTWKKFLAGTNRLVIWELPDLPGEAGKILQAARREPLQIQIKKLGGVDFLLLSAAPDAPDGEAGEMAVSR